jgi:hypothetical protein
VDAHQRIAVVVIRAWVETGSEEPLRIRITTVRDVSEPWRTVGVASGIDDACSIVRSWLERFSAEAGLTALHPDREG